MSAALAMPAVVRLGRTAGARRALTVVLFLGGFLALAFVLGGHAHAAEPSGSTVVSGSGGHAAGVAAGKRLGSSFRHTVSEVPATADAAATAADQDVERTGKAVDRALKPVLDKTGQVTAPVGGVVGIVTGGLGTLPVDTGAPVAGDAGHGCAHAPATTGRKQAPGAERVAQALHSSRAAAARHDQTTADAVTTGGARQPAAPFDAPQPITAPASQFTSGNSSSRGGADQHATLPSDRAGHGLTAGAVSSATGAPTFERPGDVLEFPA